MFITLVQAGDPTTGEALPGAAKPLAFVLLTVTGTDVPPVTPWIGRANEPLGVPGAVARALPDVSPRICCRDSTPDPMSLDLKVTPTPGVMMTVLSAAWAVVMRRVRSPANRYLMALAYHGSVYPANVPSG